LSKTLTLAEEEKKRGVLKAVAVIKGAKKERERKKINMR